MKEVVKFLLEEQGFSYGTLSEETGIKWYKLQELGCNNKNWLTTKESKKLRNLLKNGSSKIMSDPIKIFSKNNKEYLETIGIIPQKSRYQFPFFYREIDRNYVLVWYQPKTRKKTEFLFHKAIELNDFFFVGLGLSAGDGLNNPNIRNTHYVFANTNFKLVYFIYGWLETYLNVPKKNIQLFLIIPRDKSSLKTYITNKVNKKFPKKDIRVYVKNRSKNPSLYLQVGNSVFQSFYLNLFKILKNIIIEKVEYRRAFLKGLFAAEGHVKHSVYGTIESIGFAFNPKEEVELANFVLESLNKEGIKSKINEDAGYLYFCGYENMLRFFLLGIMDLHQEKRNKFIELVKTAQLSLHLKKPLLNKIKQFSQLEMGRSLGYSQSSVSNWLNKGYMNIEVFEKIFSIFNINKDELISNIKYIGVSTTKIKDKESIKFLLSFYKFQNNEFRIKVDRNVKTNQPLLFSILGSIINASRKENKICLSTVAKYSHLSKITIQQRLRKLKQASYLKFIRMDGLSKVYEMTRKGHLKYKYLERLYEIA